MVLAVEHRETPESVFYFWRLLDVEHTGKLMPATILHFYRSVAVALEEHGYFATSCSLYSSLYSSLYCYLCRDHLRPLLF